jgi:hypothetical protein
MEVAESYKVVVLNCTASHTRRSEISYSFYLYFKTRKLNSPKLSITTWHSSGGTTQLITNLGSRWRKRTALRPGWFTHGVRAPVPTAWGLAGPQRPFERFGEGTNLILPPGIEQWLLRRIARSSVTILTELTQFPCVNNTKANRQM